MKRNIKVCVMNYLLAIIILLTGGICVVSNAEAQAIKLFTVHPPGGPSLMDVWSDGKVGIGDTAPEFKLSLDNDGGIIAKGTFDSGATLRD